MRNLTLAAVALSLSAATAAAQQPTTPSTPSSPGSPTTSSPTTQPPSGTTPDSSAMGAAGQGAQGDTASLVGQVQQANEALKGGLTSVPVATARSLVSSIETKLRGTGRAPLRAIANDLRALDRELGMSEVNGRRVGVILRRVGPKVTAVSAGQSGAVRTALRELGSQLAAAGRQLTSGAAAGGN